MSERKTILMQPLVLAEPERPFWGFAELLFAAAVFVIALFTVVGLAGRYLHAPPESGLWSVLEEGVAYVLFFLFLKIMFARHGRGLLETLGWTKLGPFSPLSLAVTGLGLSLFVATLQYITVSNSADTPFEKMLEDPASRLVVGLFSVTVAPIAEELFFRGFLQPVLVSSMGVFPGILVTSLMFGALHLAQYGYIWQIGVLLTVVGFLLGTIRHLTGSTKASSIVHIAFNSLPFLVLMLAANPIAQK
jgi:membrane protease YdiL (CAAX protease family)